jgi:ceramide synthetase
MIASKDWLEDTRRAYWMDFPYPMTTDVTIYYHVSLAFYVHMIFAQFYEERKKDFTEMLVHHVTTIALLVSSWLIGFTRIGAVILVLHDMADPFLELAKCCNYSAGCKPWKASDIVFTAFAIVFAATRLYLFPRYCIYPVMFEVQGLHQTMWLQPGFLLLLLTLLVLHAYWFVLVLAMAVRLLCPATNNGSVSDVRSESESEEEIEPANTAKDSTDNDKTQRFPKNAQSPTTKPDVSPRSGIVAEEPIRLRRQSRVDCVHPPAETRTAKIPGAETKRREQRDRPTEAACLQLPPSEGAHNALRHAH